MSDLTCTYSYQSFIDPTSNIWPLKQHWMSMECPSVTLNDGNTMPMIGSNVGTGDYGLDCTDLILSALNAGYRHIETSPSYRNAESVGAALKKWDGGTRADVYIISKYGEEASNEPIQTPRQVLLQQMYLMGIDYVDMYLLDNSVSTSPHLRETWKMMEFLKAEGLTKSIGVGNFREEDLVNIRDTYRIPPAINQIEYHPYNSHTPQMISLRNLMDRENIRIEAYGPLCPLFRSKDGPVDTVVSRIARKHGVTDGQILLAWAKQKGGGGVVTLVSVIAKIAANDAEIQKMQYEELDKLYLDPADIEGIAEAGKSRYFRFDRKELWDNA